MVLIGISLSSSPMTASTPSFSIPNPSDPSASINITIGGVVRSFDMVYNVPGTGPAGRQYDSALLWIEIFMMYWWVAFVIAIEQFTTCLTIMIWFFTQQGGTALHNKPYSIFGYALKCTVTYHIGTVLTGSFMVAVIWTLITMITV
jgi:hypothetical protein